LILKSDSLIQLPSYAELLGDLTLTILFTLIEEIGAVPPALTAAYAALSID
jgi:energy-converting hydrogenase Eha subunit B